MSTIINQIIHAIISFLPNDPLANYIESINLGIISPTWLKWLNWFIPVHDMIIVFGLWVSAVLIYELIKLFMKGFQAFGGLSGML